MEENMGDTYLVEPNVYVNGKCSKIYKFGCVIRGGANSSVNIHPKRDVKGSYCGYIEVPIFI